MAIKEFGSGNGSSNPFFDEWAKELSDKEKASYDGYEEEAISVKEAISGKGYLVDFKDFRLFLFKNSAQGGYFKKCFDRLSNNEEIKAEPIGILLTNGKKRLTNVVGFVEDVEKHYLLEQPDEDTITFESGEERRKRIEAKATAKAARAARAIEQEKLLERIDKIPRSK